MTKHKRPNAIKQDHPDIQPHISPLNSTHTQNLFYLCWNETDTNTNNPYPSSITMHAIFLVPRNSNILIAAAFAIHFLISIEMCIDNCFIFLCSKFVFQLRIRFFCQPNDFRWSMEKWYKISINRRNNRAPSGYDLCTEEKTTLNIKKK